MSTESPQKQALRKIKSTLLKYGWIQGAFENGDGAVCLLGAVRKVERGGKPETSVEKGRNYVPGVRGLLQKAIAEKHRQEYPTSLVPATASWNDTKGRTKEEVLEVVDTALEKAA